VDNFIVQIKSNKIHNFWKGITFNLPGLRVSAGRNKIVVRWREKMNTRIKCRVGFLRQCNPALGSLPQTQIKPYFTNSLLNAKSLVMKIWLKRHFGEGGHTHTTFDLTHYQLAFYPAMPHKCPDGLQAAYMRSLTLRHSHSPLKEGYTSNRQ
jgi:hypothetical protein